MDALPTHPSAHPAHARTSVCSSHAALHALVFVHGAHGPSLHGKVSLPDPAHNSPVQPSQRRVRLRSQLAGHVACVHCHAVHAHGTPASHASVASLAPGQAGPQVPSHARRWPIVPAPHVVLHCETLAHVPHVRGMPPEHELYSVVLPTHAGPVQPVHVRASCSTPVPPHPAVHDPPTTAHVDHAFTGPATHSTTVTAAPLHATGMQPLHAREYVMLPAPHVAEHGCTTDHAVQSNFGPSAQSRYW